MYLDEQYTMYNMAYQIVSREAYNVLYVNEQGNEIWLEKKVGKDSKVLRFINQGFDWKNYLKKDIAVVFQKVKAMKKLLRAKTIQIHNIYISEFTPVDSWEFLKQPMKLNEKQAIMMKIYYLSNSQFEEEKDRLEKEAEISALELDDSLEETVKEEKIVTYKHYLRKRILDDQKEKKELFSFGKPRLTYIILALCVSLFLLLEWNGGSENIETLKQFGAKYNPAIIENGEWWRIISSMFLHIGLLHLVMNMIAVYYLGTLVERIYGSIRFLIIYFLAGIGGGIASFAFSANIAAGASGALFGLFGALLFFGLHHRRVFFQTIGSNVLLLIGINIVFGFSIPAIDNGAHLGGLVAGFIASGIVHLPKQKERWKQLSAVLVYLALAYGIIQYGITNNMNSPMYYVMHIEELVQEEKYEQVVTEASKAIRNTEGEEQWKAAILFHRSYAYIELNQKNLAMDDLKQSVQLDNSFPEAHYNLALLYYQQGNIEEAKDFIKRAYQLDSNNTDFQEMYEQITGEKPK
ncbi:rhomboid family intramembrane serine protease [Virgibacillus dokdonensis]|uniref:Rhomboid family intramembrane serine protease n=1 Tax=Virgibacillus dokdonensis TaxID=302167 RepID=A0A3E0WWM3_9BACI|nr:rhomboid family intramembrane serine protease [Virgibacillus dokdonensis]RFA36406.1 rhomboid family intramembrane serine protease [Virgibacillus dokdonensis]